MLKRYGICFWLMIVLIPSVGCTKATPALIETSLHPSPLATMPPTDITTMLPAIATLSPPTTAPIPTTILPTAISPKNLAVISSENAGQVECLGTLTGHTNRVMTLAFSWDGTYLASSSRDNTIKLWDIWNGKEITAFPLVRGDLNAIAFSPIENLLASSDAIWDVESMEIVYTLGQGRREPGHVAFSPDGSTLAVAIFGEPIILWDIASGQVVRTYEQHADTPEYGIEFSPDGSQIAAGESFGTVRLWDVASGQVVTTFEYSKDDDVHDVAFSPDGHFLASGGTDNTIRVWDLANGQMVQTLRHGNGMYGVTFSPDGSLLASAVCDRSVKLWELATGRLLRSLPHADEMITVAFSPDGTLLASGGYDNLIYLWGVPR